SPATSTGSGGDGGCPLCATPLEADMIGEVRIARCGSCAGAWIAHVSLVALRAGIVDDDTDIVPTDPFLTRVLDAIGRLLMPGRWVFVSGCPAADRSSPARRDDPRQRAGVEWKPNGEPRAAARRALHLDVAPEKLAETFGDRETETGAAEL